MLSHHLRAPSTDPKPFPLSSATRHTPGILNADVDNDANVRVLKRHCIMHASDLCSSNDRSGQSTVRLDMLTRQPSPLTALRSIKFAAIRAAIEIKSRPNR